MKLSKPNLVKIVFVILCIGILGSPRAHAEPDSVSEKYIAFRPSVETYPVTIHINGAVLNIQRNYLETAVLNDNGTAFFQVVMHFPDFNGATEKTIGEFAYGSRWHSPNIIELKRDTAPKNASSFAKRVVELEKDVPQHDKLYGLLVSKRAPLYPRADVYYTTNESTKENFVIECRWNNDPNPKRCQSHFDVVPGVVVMCEYDAALLPHWQDIRTQVIQFIKNIKVGG